MIFNGTNGANPGDLILSNNVLYGMTGRGGEYNNGYIFKINTDGSGFKDLLDFNGINGTGGGMLTISGNVLFGISTESSEIFKINTDGSEFETLISFNEFQGIFPNYLIFSDSVLYGTTDEGGDMSVDTINPSYTPGCIFKYDVRSILQATNTNITKVISPVEVFPNPTLGIINVFAKEGLGVLTLTDLSGRIVKKINITESQTQLDVSNIPAGCYIISIQMENTIEISKLIKE